MASSSNSKRPSSSSSSSSNSKWRYDVFLSFRGEDTRNNFTSHLYKALDHANIETFKDDKELRRGEEIAPELLKAIEGSRIALIVFSKTYAHSKWCLDELAKIMECEEERGQKVFPIFYHVEPSEARNQTGIYGEAFNNHESNADEEKKKKIEKWRTALRKAGNLSGFPLQDRSESEFIEKIIGEIRRLIPKLVHVGENIVGMDENLKEVELLIKAQSNGVSMVGIYGIGGIGKTTIAKVVYNDMLDQFQRHSFLENVREKSKDDHGLLELQEKLLCDILMEKNLMLGNIDDGIKMIKSKCCIEKVLIVLDDVDCQKQLKFLAPNFDCFHRGSIIIVTTRNKRCLDVHESYSSYEAKGLAHEQAKELFCWNAFRKHHPKDKYVDLSNRILDYAKGLPLALVVLGSFLFQRDVDEWESTLDKLKTNPLEDIQKVLQISYDGLDDKCKKLFLDIACFFKDKRETFVTRILEGCKFHPKIGLRVLDERCLISITNDIIRMHDLLQEMGWAIVRQIDPERPGKWSRLWEYEDIETVFTRNKGTKNIEGIFINRSRGVVKGIQLTVEAFRKMNRLRLLSVEFNHMVQLSQDFELPCHDLVYFHWNNYPLESLPSNFHPDNLVELNLRYGNIKHLWEGNMPAKKLKVIDLTYSRHLVDISSISSMPNLETLILKGCNRLESLPRNLHKLKCLQTLSCDGCSAIKSFPEIEEEMRSLRMLNLRGTGIMALPSSIRHLNGVEDLDLSCCKNLLSLPDSIGSLKALKLLDLSNCKKLESLPEGIYNLSSLKLLKVGSRPKFMGELWMEQWRLRCYISNSGVIWNNCSVSSLKALNPWCLSSLVELLVRNSDLMEQSIPSGSFYLSLLQELSLRNFHIIEGGIVSDIVRDIFHLSSLKKLYLDGNHFSSLPVGLSRLTNLRVLGLSHCKNLQQLPDLPSSLRFLDAHCSGGTSSSPSPLLIHSMVNCFNPKIQKPGVGHTYFKRKGISIVIPKSSGILDWISYQSMEGHKVTIELPLNWYKNKDLWGFALCCVYKSRSESTDTSDDDPNNGSSYEFENDSFDSSDNEADNGSSYESENESDDASDNETHNGSSYESADTSDNEEPEEFGGNLSTRVNNQLPFFDSRAIMDFLSLPSSRRSKDQLVRALRGDGLKELCCNLSIQGNDESEVVNNFRLVSRCVNDGTSDGVWVIFYPKAAIKPWERTNEYTHLKASFCSSAPFGRVEECGSRLIYTKDYEQKHPTMAQGSTSHGNFGEHGSVREDTNSKAHNKRNPTEQSLGEESHH